MYMYTYIQCRCMYMNIHTVHVPTHTCPAKSQARKWTGGLEEWKGTLLCSGQCQSAMSMPSVRSTFSSGRPLSLRSSVVFPLIPLPMKNSFTVLFWTDLCTYVVYNNEYHYMYIRIYMYSRARYCTYVYIYVQCIHTTHMYIHVCT